MPDLESDALEQAVAAIERYLAQHPTAADSEQGIAQWWLPAMGVDAPLDRVVGALERLRERGRIERTTLPGGQAIWLRAAAS